jgi:hypothetical protein
MKAIRTTLVLITAVATVAHYVCAEEARREATIPSHDVWSRSYQLTPGPLSGDSHSGLNLLIVQQDPALLWALMVLERRVPGSASGLVLAGHLKKDGAFAANVDVAVSEREDSGWKSVYSSLKEPADVRLVAAPHIEKLYFEVPLNAAQEFLNAAKFCRVRLQTGESFVFPIVWLTPTGKG